MEAPLRLVITRHGVRALLDVGVSLLPSQWDSLRQCITDTRCKQLNKLIVERKFQIDTVLYRLETQGELTDLKASQIKDKVERELYHTDDGQEPVLTFISRFDAFTATKTGGTLRLYRATRNRLADFVGTELQSLTFEQIDVPWLRRFDAFLAKTSPARNARNIHFRNIRTVFNDALSDEIITCYPFRKFKLRPEPTRKRALSIERLRSLFNMAVAQHEERYRDFFIMSFMLCGINAIDLCQLGKKAIVDGRIEYRRAKTHRLYSVKIEPELDLLLNKYKGRDWLINFHDNCRSYRSFYLRASSYLREFGVRIGVDGLTSYWARHSWATIAASLDIPKDTIAAALGHGGCTVTDIYIDFDQTKVDVANRRVIDWVLYGKR